MNAFTNIVADPVETAVAAANAWVRTATPIIKAYLALDMIDGDLRAAAHDFRGHKRWNEPVEYDERVCTEVRSDITKAAEQVYATIEGIREDFICDHWAHEPDGPADDSDAAAHAYDAACDTCMEFNDRLKRETISVDAAVKQIGEF
jgi:hypothetical protein